MLFYHSINLIFDAEVAEKILNGHCKARTFHSDKRGLGSIHLRCPLKHADILHWWSLAAFFHTFTPNPRLFHLSKSQLISEWIYEVIVFFENTNEKLSGLLPCVVRAEILTIFRSYFGRKDDFINSFWN